MRARMLFLAVTALLATAGTSPAQISLFGSARSTTTSAPSSPTTNIFTNSFAKPDFSAVAAKPKVQTPLSLTSMMPSWSNLTDTFSLRNVFASQPTTTYILKKNVPTQTPAKGAMYNANNNYNNQRTMSPFFP